MRIRNVGEIAACDLSGFCPAKAVNSVLRSRNSFNIGEGYEL